MESYHRTFRPLMDKLSELLAEARKNETELQTEEALWKTGELPPGRVNLLERIQYQRGIGEGVRSALKALETHIQSESESKRALIELTQSCLDEEL